MLLSVAFVSLTLFNQLRSPMTMVCETSMIAGHDHNCSLACLSIKQFKCSYQIDVSKVNECLVSTIISSLADLLTAEEVDPNAVDRSMPSGGDEKSNDAIKIDHADLAWEGEAERALHQQTHGDSLTLENVSLSVPHGSLIAVVGSVGELRCAQSYRTICNLH